VKYSPLAADLQDLLKGNSSESIISHVRTRYELPHIPLRDVFAEVYARQDGLAARTRGVEAHEQYRLTGVIPLDFARCLLPDCLTMR